MKKSMALALSAIAMTGAPARAADETKVGLLAYLGLDAAKGETKLEQDGAQMETWTIATSLMGATAQTVAAKVNAVAMLPGDKVIVLADSDGFAWQDYSIVLGRTAALDELISALLTTAGCVGKGVAAQNAAIDEASIIPAVLGALKTDVSISGSKITLDDRTMVNAVAGAIGAKAYLVDGVATTADSALQAKWNALAIRAAALATAPCKETAAAKAALAAFNAAETAFMAPGKDGQPSMFAAALATEPYLKEPVPYVLRVRVEMAGGTILKRSNIWTTLGAPALGMSGGLITSYRLTSANGNVKWAAAVACYAPLAGLRSVSRTARAFAKSSGETQCFDTSQALPR